MQNKDHILKYTFLSENEIINEIDLNNFKLQQLRFQIKNLKSKLHELESNLVGCKIASDRLNEQLRIIKESAVINDN
jgi:hypothetical protein